MQFGWSGMVFYFVFIVLIIYIYSSLIKRISLKKICQQIKLLFWMTKKIE